MFFLRELPSREMLESFAARFPNMNPDATLEALTRLRWASRLDRELETFFSTHGLSFSRFLALMVLAREASVAGGREQLQPSEIADKMDISRPIVTNLLKQLGKQGFVARLPSDDEGDQRVRRVSLTEEGRARLHSLLPDYYNILNKHMREEA